MRAQRLAAAAFRCLSLLFRGYPLRSLAMPAGPLQAAKRALVRILNALAAAYHVAITVDRDSSDEDIVRAFRRMSARVHPDKGGSTQDSQQLNAARDEWLRAGGGRAGGGPHGAGSPHSSVISLAPRPRVPTDRKQYRINATAVLLTYQGLLHD